MDIKHRLLIASFIVTVAFFITILMVGEFLNSQRENYVNKQFESVSQDITDIQTLVLLADSYQGGLACPSFEKKLRELDSYLWKLGDKLDTAKKTARFNDVLKERNDLAGYEQNKKRKIALIKPKFDELFGLVENTDIVQDYKEHFEKAFVNDFDLEILDKVETIEDGELKQWFKENVEAVQKELTSLNTKIKNQLTITNSTQNPY